MFTKDFTFFDVDEPFIDISSKKVHIDKKVNSSIDKQKIKSKNKQGVNDRTGKKVKAEKVFEHCNVIIGKTDTYGDHHNELGQFVSWKPC